VQSKQRLAILLFGSIFFILLTAVILLLVSSVWPSY